MEHPDFSPRDRKPLNRLTLNLIGVIIGISPHMQSLVFLPFLKAVLYMREIVITHVYSLPPLFFTFLCNCKDRTI